MRRNKTASDIKEMTAALTSAKFNVGDLVSLRQHVPVGNFSILGIVIGMCRERIEHGLVRVLTMDGRIVSWDYIVLRRLA